MPARRSTQAQASAQEHAGARRSPQAGARRPRAQEHAGARRQEHAGRARRSTQEHAGHAGSAQEHAGPSRGIDTQMHACTGRHTHTIAPTCTSTPMRACATAGWRPSWFATHTHGRTHTCTHAHTFDHKQTNTTRALAHIEAQTHTIYHMNTRADTHRSRPASFMSRRTSMAMRSARNSAEKAAVPAHSVRLVRRTSRSHVTRSAWPRQRPAHVSIITQAGGALAKPESASARRPAA